MCHLHQLSLSSHVTGMTCRNLALVWAPNLLRSQHETMLGVSEESLRDIGVQAKVVEFMISHYETLFTGAGAETSDHQRPVRQHRRQPTRVFHGSFSSFPDPGHEDRKLSLQPEPGHYSPVSPVSRYQTVNSYSQEQTKHLPKVTSYQHLSRTNIDTG